MKGSKTVGPIKEGITPEQRVVVEQLRADAEASGKSLRAIGRDSNVGAATVSQVMRGGRWMSPAVYAALVRTMTGRMPDARRLAEYTAAAASITIIGTGSLGTLETPTGSVPQSCTYVTVRSMPMDSGEGRIVIERDGWKATVHMKPGSWCSGNAGPRR